MGDQAALVKVSCPHCAYSAQVDRNRIPEGGAQARCPRCKGKFQVPPPQPAATPPAAPALTQPAATPPAAAAPTPPVATPPVAAEPLRVSRSGKEKRQYRRLPFAVDVLVNKAVLLKAIDISQGGLYVHTGRSFAPGSIIEVELPLGTQKISVKGTVQHNQNGVGIGVKFLDLSTEHQNAILDYIQNAEALGRRVGDSRQRILIIDEDAMKRRMSKSKLIHEGFSIVEVEDGSEAIRRMGEETPDLVILDLFMQKVDGFKVLSTIKESPMWKDIPVLIYSSKGGDEVAERALAAGAAVFLLKMTTTPTKLAEIVKRTLSS